MAALTGGSWADGAGGVGAGRSGAAEAGAGSGAAGRGAGAATGSRAAPQTTPQSAGRGDPGSRVDQAPSHGGTSRGGARSWGDTVARGRGRSTEGSGGASPRWRGPGGGKSRGDAPWGRKRGPGGGGAVRGPEAGLAARASRWDGAEGPAEAESV